MRYILRAENLDNPSCLRALKQGNELPLTPSHILTCLPAQGSSTTQNTALMHVFWIHRGSRCRGNPTVELGKTTHEQRFYIRILIFFFSLLMHPLKVHFIY